MMKSKVNARQPWIRGNAYDTFFILSPPFLSLLVVALMPRSFKYTNAMPLAGWCILVLTVDVAHVYSTLYNTYFDKARYGRQRILFLLTPIVCYIAGALLCFCGWMVFWRTITYLAVFHFIRQQYGFMRLYARRSSVKSPFPVVDTLVIYAATIYPLVYWHCTPSRNFNWFIEDDFFITAATSVKQLTFYLYILTVMAWVLQEATLLMRHRTLNMPKNLVILGTIVSWYFGIVYFNGDMAFTLLNTVSHGIPYMALIWAGLKNNTEKPYNSNPKRALPAHWYGALIFIASLIVLAYVEEGFWDGFVWREHLTVFFMFSHLPQINSDTWLALLVPLLSLPQSTHYVLDGFIWRKRYA